MTRRSPQRRIADQHITREGYKEYDRRNPRKVRYNVYECEHCDKQFTVEEGVIRSNMDRRVIDHLKDEHPGQLEREPYPNEDVFQEWAESIGERVEEPRVPGDALMVRWNEMAYVYLENDGTIHLEANRVLGGGQNGHEVSLEGERLVVRRHRKAGYVSRDAFPVMRR